MKFTLENTQQYSSLKLLRLWCMMSWDKALSSGTPLFLLERTESFLQAVGNGPFSLAFDSAYSLLCAAQQEAGLMAAPIDFSADTLGQLWILRYEIEKKTQHHASGSSTFSGPLISTGIHIHRTKENSTTVSALYIDFDNEDLWKMYFPDINREGVVAVDRYLKAANARLISDDMDVMHKKMVPALGQMLGWLLEQPQVSPMLDLVAKEVVN